MQNHHWILQTLNYQRRPFLNKSGKYLNVCVRIKSSRCIWLHVFEVTVSIGGWWMIASYFISASQLLVSLLYIAIFISLFKFKVLYQFIFIQYCVSYIDMLRTGQLSYAWRCNTCTYAFTCILSHNNNWFALYVHVICMTCIILINITLYYYWLGTEYCYII